MKYIVAEPTIAELSEHDGHKTIYTHVCPHREWSEEKKRLQADRKWVAQQSRNLYLSKDMIKDIAASTVRELVASGYRDELFPKAVQEVMDAKTYAVLDLVNGATPAQNNIFAELTAKEPADTSRDMDELTAKLDSWTEIQSWKNDQEIDLESIELRSYRPYHIRPEIIPNIVKSAIRNELTYCLKNGKSIVPDEYLQKGTVGIEEWQSYKRSRCKNNSMEKRVLRTALREKKARLANIFQWMSAQCVTCPNQNWTIPTIAVDGRYNKQKMSKGVTAMLKDKTDIEIMSLTDDDMKKLVIAYYQEIFSRANQNLLSYEIRG